METKVLKLESPTDQEVIEKGAMIIKNGGLVAFPTETVYGLGANGLDQEAVCKIYEAKGRPSDNPMILHISSREMLEKLVRDIPKAAEDCMDMFWPGPLTMIFFKKDIIPEKVCAGLDTVAIRMPSDSFARNLIERSGVPIAAPSANTSGRPSPTKASHVLEDMAGKIDLIVDGGPTEVGIESTVLDMTVNPPMLLRPGGVTLEDLKALLGEVDVDPALLGGKPKEVLHPKSPGQKYKHYAPKAECLLFAGNLKNVAKEVDKRIKENPNKKIAVLATEETLDLYREKPYLMINMGSREHLQEIAHNIFNALRECDEAEVDLIYVEGFSFQGMGQGIMNRLLKACGGKVVLGL